ncbi:hypothetical protein [Blastopirellula marina]|uniref:hypothetical protein n=1 Tax=Blastopirellula marina TaxID=124 RepID=UPI001304A594|nr:hypothetical protein [Blastopirellula marina]
MKNSWESIVTLGNTLLWAASFASIALAVHLMTWASSWALLAADAFLSSIVRA